MLDFIIFWLLFLAGLAVILYGVIVVSTAIIERLDKLDKIDVDMEDV